MIIYFGKVFFSSNAHIAFVDMIDWLIDLIKIDV